MSSRTRADRQPVDFGRDVPTTRDDIEALRRLRRQTPSWLTLTPAELEALIPDGALDRRPTTPATARPFTLPDRADP